MRNINMVRMFDGSGDITLEEFQRASELIGQHVTTGQWLRAAVEDRETAHLDKTYGGYQFHETDHGPCQCNSCQMVRGHYEAIGQTIDNIVWQAITGEEAVSLPFDLTYWGDNDQQSRYDEMRAQAREQALALQDHDLIARASALGDKCWGGHALVNFARASAILAECKRLSAEREQATR